MGELNNTYSVNGKKAGINKRRKKFSTRVDLTPMVDLGFLLITFFIFTTTMTSARTMKLNLPADTKDSSAVKRSGALTILLGGSNVVYYYEGDMAIGGSNINKSSLMGIREIIGMKKKLVPAKDLFVIIKPGKESVYGNSVDILDEMIINDIKGYALVDISPQEQQLIALRD